MKTDTIFARSPAMRTVMRQIAAAANSRAGVLIVGERGTGREIVARAIHAQQPSSDAPFVTLDCSKDATSDLQLELIGIPSPRSPHVGAERRAFERVSRQSRIEQARGGTLFLKNLWEMPARLQARLARLLRDREAVLADTGEPIDLDVRPVAAAESASDEAVDEGRIRPDLFKRLSAIRIDLPPLRNRRDDIPALARLYIEEICQSLNVPAKSFTAQAMQLLKALPLPGNASELRAVLEALIVQVPARTIKLQDVLASVSLDGARTTAMMTGKSLRDARAAFEREYIAAVLKQHQGRIRESARALGIQRTNLYRKIRGLKISRS